MKALAVKIKDDGCTTRCPTIVSYELVGVVVDFDITVHGQVIKARLLDSYRFLCGYNRLAIDGFNRLNNKRIVGATKSRRVNKRAVKVVVGGISVRV